MRERSYVDGVSALLAVSALTNGTTVLVQGWTMGNIATAPIDVARFFFELLAKKTLVGGSAIAQMTSWHTMTTGFMACPSTAPADSCLLYGLGLMQLPYIYPATSGCPGHRACMCKSDAAADCEVQILLHGHLGEDWGSGSPLAGFLPQFNVSVAMAMNAALGMNTTIDARANLRASDAVICRILQAVATGILPTFPGFRCS